MSPHVTRRLRYMHRLSLFLFIVSCYYSLYVSSEFSPADKTGALSVVPSEENDDGVTIDSEDDIDSTNSKAETDRDPLDVFYPTKAWKDVKEGQSIPSGLHVRMDLQSGRKQAKLMDGDDGLRYWESGDKKGMLNPKKQSFSREELKQALKEFKATTTDEDELRAKEVKKKFKTYEELKSEFKKINVDVKTDLEIMTDMVAFLKEDLGSEDRLLLLTDLEYHVHQIDNAQLFCDLGGMEAIMKDLNDTREEIRMEAALVIGSAVQSNPKVQVAAIEAGVMHQLIRILSTDKSFAVRKKVLFAISSLIRHFPYAQMKFLELGGLSTFSQLFGESGTEILRIKIVTLLSDLLLEQEHSAQYADVDSVQQEKLRQYENVPLKKFLIENKWCELIPTLLDMGEHDAREGVLQAMSALMSSCRDRFRTNQQSLQQLRREYEELAQEEPEDDKYFVYILQTINDVLSAVTVKDEL